MNIQLQMLTHLEKITKEPNRRNCACFVANGVVYTKLKAPLNRKQPPAAGTEDGLAKRSKRSTSIEGLHEIHESTPAVIIELIRLNEELDQVSLRLSTQNLRKKRSAEDVVDVIAEIQRNLSSLEDTFRNSTDHASEKCSVATGGHVNCSSSVYEDEKSWKRSRHQIDLLIRVLKKKISDLKDIRKHLKEHKPVSIKEDYEDVNSKEEEEKHHHHHHQEVVGNAIKKEADEEMGPLIDMGWYTSTTEKESSVIGESVSPSTPKSLFTRGDIQSTTTEKIVSTVTSVKRRVNKRPQGSTTTSPTSTGLAEDDTKIPIFYIGEDKEEAPVKPNITTEGPEKELSTTTAESTSEVTTTPSSVTEASTTTTVESTSADPEKSVDVETTSSTSQKPHRHNHGINSHRSQHHHNHGGHHGQEQQQQRRTSDTTEPATECYCDLETEK